MPIALHLMRTALCSRLAPSSQMNLKRHHSHFKRQHRPHQQQGQRDSTSLRPVRIRHPCPRLVRCLAPVRISLNYLPSLPLSQPFPRHSMPIQLFNHLQTQLILEPQPTTHFNINQLGKYTFFFEKLFTDKCFFFSSAGASQDASAQNRQIKKAKRRLRQ